MKYYELFFNSRIPDQWVLADPIDEHGREIDPWQFCEGRSLEIRERLRLPYATPGHALDISFTTLSIPVIHGRVLSLFDRMSLQQQVQFFAAHVEGQSEPFYILNILRIIRCIDDARCEEVQYWKPEDRNPDKVGQYRVVYGLRIDTSKVGDAHIFRPWGWRSALIVSERLKRAMEEEQMSGTRFTAV